MNVVEPLSAERIRAQLVPILGEAVAVSRIPAGFAIGSADVLDRSGDPIDMYLVVDTHEMYLLDDGSFLGGLAASGLELAAGALASRVAGILGEADLRWDRESGEIRTAPFRPGSLPARVRAFAAAIGCDIHPIQNLRVMKKVKTDYGADQDGAQAWARHWIETGFNALERLAEDAGGKNGYIFGDAPTFAEVYLLPQMYNARRFGVDLDPYPRLVAADAAARVLPPFERAAPENQPDAPKA